jgi:hypothetical protein
MALIAALLLCVLLSTALGAMTLVAGIERRAAGAHAARLQLRLSAEGALIICARALEAGGLQPALDGWGAAAWRRPMSPLIDLVATGAALQQQTVSASTHGADTPMWQLYAFAPWQAVTGTPSPVRFAAWVADDWEERDGDPRRDTNGRALLRVRAVAEPAGAWAEAVAQREDSGLVRLRHVRTW